MILPVVCAQLLLAWASVAAGGCMYLGHGSTHWWAVLRTNGHSHVYRSPSSPYFRATLASGPPAALPARYPLSTTFLLGATYAQAALRGAMALRL